MGKYYSIDLRERAVRAFLGGESCRSVGERFEIAPSTVVKWAALLEGSGGLEHGKVGGHRPRLLEPHRAWIIARLRETSHLTLHKLAAELETRGVKVTHDTVWRFLRAEGLSFKKNTVRNRAGARRRGAPPQALAHRAAPARSRSAGLSR